MKNHDLERWCIRRILVDQEEVEKEVGKEVEECVCQCR
jgi:hypothetical protein